MKIKALAIAVIATLTALPAAAHHSFDGAFDRDRQVSLTGKVTEFSFGNPHAYFKLAVAGPDGAIQVWHVETTQPQTLERHGWTADSIKPGQTLTIEGWPARTSRPYVRLGTMTGAQGEPIALWLPPGPSPLPASVAL